MLSAGRRITDPYRCRMTRFRHAVAALCCALPLSLITASSATADTSFAAPAYPSAACTPVVAGLGTGGLAPQQWRASVGLPLTPSGTPAAQRIVVGEFDQQPNMDAVNDLLEQCGLDTLSVTTHANSNGAAGASTVGLESTLDFTVIGSALPANATVTLVNSPAASPGGQWYGLLVNIAEACGLQFDGDPWTGLRTASKGAGFPSGGCIASISYGGVEDTVSSAERSDVDSVMDQLTANGVIIAVSAGDEGSGGCITAAGATFTGDGTTVPVTGIQVTSNIATMTTSSAHGFTAGQQVFLGALSPAYDGMYRVLTTPSATTFTVAIVAPDQTDTVSAVASVDFGGLTPQFLAIHPDALAVGGTQWDTQTQSLASGLNVTYAPGSSLSNRVWWDSNPNSNCANLPDYPASGGEATGGGISTVYAMPAYQSAAATASYPSQPAQRMMPDLAALAGWPAYAIANPGVGVQGAALTSNTATLTVPQAHAFSVGETVTVSLLPSPFTGLNGSFSITAVSGNTISYAVTGSDIPAAYVAAGQIAQSCSVPCDPALFPWTPVVGTSAATPLTAIGIANVNATLTAQGLPPIVNDGGAMDVHSIVYDTRNASAFTDVVDGSNDIHGLGGYTALTGYDMVTGMGVPNFAVLSRILIERLTQSPGGGGGSTSPSAPSTSDAAVGEPLAPETPTAVPDPIAPVVVPTVFSPGPGVRVSTGPLTSATTRVVAPRATTRKVQRAPRLEIPRRKWRVPVLKVRGDSREYAVQIRIDREWKPLSVETSNRRGRVVLPSLRIAKVGTYRLRLIDASGTTTFAVLKVIRR